jgi:hypothetical protein
VVGDLNMDLKSDLGRPLNDTMSTYGLTNVINEPTRVSTNSYKGVLKTRKTLLNVCFTNDPELLFFSATQNTSFVKLICVFGLCFKNTNQS